MRRFVKKKTSVLDEHITKVLDSMRAYGPDAPEYPALIEHLERLNRLKGENPRNRVDANTLAVVAGNLLGILVIVAYEQKHVMVSKGLGFVIRSKDLHS